MSVDLSSSSIATASSSPSGTNVCHTCNDVITTSQFIRVGNYKFHKDHFTCCECKQTLHGKKFHHKDGKFYCANDYVEKYCHTCRHCGQKISSGSVIQAFGGYYHPDHFVCKTCGLPFKNGKYYEHESQPLCETHYFAMVAEKCDTCGLPVKESDLVRVSGKLYHNQCLSCSHCGAQLAKKGSIFQRDGKVYCRNDYLNFFCKRCTQCGDFILRHCISVNDEYYHPDCLQCSICQKKLEKYICIGGYLRCPEHSEFACPKITCSVCTKHIENDDAILSVGKKCHPACYVCQTCKTPLQKSTCKLKDNKLSCPNCMAKRDGNTKISTPTSPINNNTNSSTSSSSSSSTSPRSFSLDSTVNSAVSPTSAKNTNPLSASTLNTNSTTSSSSSKGRRGSNGKDNDSDDDEKLSSSSSSASSTSTPSANNKLAPAKPSGRKPSRAGAPSSSSSSSSSHHLHLNRIEWKKGDLIGKGSFGKVYMAMNSSTGELIAVKQVRLNTAEEQEQATAIQNEIGLMENLRHPNIVALLGTERVGNKLNIIMEYVAGRSLDSLLEKFGAFSEKIIRSYTKQLLGALDYCHSFRIVHRDVKGKNILIDTKGNLKLADFGSAKRFQNTMSKDAPSLSYNYTPLWTAPEVLTGDYNSKVDIWSMGCVIIEMATAKPPWSEQNFENPFRALYHIGNTDSIPKIPEHISEMGKSFILYTLRRDPDKRPNAAECLAHEWLQGLDDVGGDEEEDDDRRDNEDSEDEEDREDVKKTGKFSSNNGNASKVKSTPQKKNHKDDDSSGDDK